MKCPNCKTDNPEGERFCWRCHLPLEEGGQKWAGHAAMVKGRRRTLKFLLFVGVGAAVAFSAIQLTFRRSPAGVVEAFTKARQRLDYRGMYLLLTRQAQKDLGARGVRDLWPEQTGVKYKFAVLEWRAKGDKALVKLAVDKEGGASERQPEASPGGRQETMQLAKEEGRWRIEFGTAEPR